MIVVLESFSQPEELEVVEEAAQVHCCHWCVLALAFWPHSVEVEGEELAALWEIPERAYPWRLLPESPQETLLVDYYYYC